MRELTKIERGMCWACPLGLVAAAAVWWFGDGPLATVLIALLGIGVVAPTLPCVLLLFPGIVRAMDEADARLGAALDARDRERGWKAWTW